MKRAHLIPLFLLGLALSVGGYALRAEASYMGPTVVTQAALAARPIVSDAILMAQFNGEMTRLGVLETSGTSVNNTTTATTFTVTTSSCASRIIMYDCDTANVAIGSGTTCSTDLTSADNKPVTGAAHEWRYFYLDATSATTLICLDSNAVAAKCGVHCVR